MKRIFSCFFTFFILVSTCMAADFKEVLITPFDEVKQGQTVFIKIKSPKELKNPTFSYKNKVYRIFKTGKEEYSGLLGIDALEKPDKYKISMTDDTGYLNDTAFIEVVEAGFPSQNIVLTKRMSGLSATKHELIQIGKAKSMLTDKFLGAPPPYDSPTSGCINSIFGVKRYYNGKFSGNYHKGVDIKADEGTPVQAITDGKVIFAEDFHLHGTSVAIDHGHGLVSLYIHLSKVAVEPGEKVEQAQKIGEVGETGFATGPHLHWGLYVNGTAIDPMKDWIKPVNLCQ